MFDYGVSLYFLEERLLKDRLAGEHQAIIGGMSRVWHAVEPSGKREATEIACSALYDEASRSSITGFGKAE
jgi:hypothetical protein